MDSKVMDKSIVCGFFGLPCTCSLLQGRQRASEPRPQVFEIRERTDRQTADMHIFRNTSYLFFGGGKIITINDHCDT